MTIRVKPTYAVAGTTVVNTATATQKEWEPTPEDNTDTVETIVKGEANVEITKTAAPTNPRPGDIVTYTLKAKNIGTAIAAGREHHRLAAGRRHFRLGRRAVRRDRRHGQLRHRFARTRVRRRPTR